MEEIEALKTQAAVQERAIDASKSELSAAQSRLAAGDGR